MVYNKEGLYVVQATYLSHVGWSSTPYGIKSGIQPNGAAASTWNMAKVKENTENHKLNLKAFART